MSGTPKRERKRPSFDEIHMRTAHHYAERSTCRRLQVGAVLANAEGYAISQGYNGSARGLAHCPDGLEDHHAWSKLHEIHAEENALLFCARSSSSSVGCTIYVTTFPCTKCASLLIQAGVARVVYAERYDRDKGNDSERKLREANVAIKRLSTKP